MCVPLRVAGEGVGGCNGWVHPQCVGHEVTMTSLRADETYVCTMCRKVCHPIALHSGFLRTIKARRLFAVTQVLGLARDELSASDCPEIIRALEAVKCGLFTGYPGAVGPPPDDPPPNPHPQRPPPRPSKKKSVAPETDSQPAPVDAAVALGPPRPQLQQHQHIMPLQYMGQWEQHHATGYSLQYGQPPQLAGPGYLPLYGGTPGYGTQYGPPSYPQPPYYSPVHPFGYPRMPSAYTGYTQLYPHYQHTPPQ